MTRARYIFVIIAVLAVAAYMPNIIFAQDTGPGAVDPNWQAPEPKGGVAIVIGVDQPENCLRIRSGPGNFYDIIGCANLGDQLNITGVWTSNNWAQLVDNGWVYGDQIQTDLRPPQQAYSEVENYVVAEDVYPEYYTYRDSYLPTYGYRTFWYGGLPVYLYNLGVWHKYHPWWRRHKHWRHNTVWDGRRDFRQGLRASKSRNFVTNRFRTPSSNVPRLNAKRFRSGTSNLVRSGRTFSSPNTIRTRNFAGRQSRYLNVPQFNTQKIRSGSSSVFRSGRTFSSPKAFRTGNIGVRNFSAPRFSRQSFNVGRSMNVGRSFSGVGRNFSVGGGRGFSGVGGFGGGGRRK